MERQPLYRGKAKSLYAGEDPGLLIAEFRDDLSAFDGQKKAQASGKGAIACRMTGIIMRYLENHGISTHFVRALGEREMLVRRLEMIPLECVWRNLAAGSLCKRLGVPQGMALKRPIFEFFLKDDHLHDPMVNASHILAFGWAKEEEMQAMEEATARVNEVLYPLFLRAGMILVDFKLEFGRGEGGRLFLADEISPDGARLWDVLTKSPLDKDRFRQDLGGVEEAYAQVLLRLEKALSAS